MNLEENKPKDVIAGKDGTLLDDVFDIERRQEAAVLRAGAVLAEEFGAQVDVQSYKIQKDGSLVVVYQIRKNP